MPSENKPWEEWAEQQQCVVSRRQLLASGLTPSRARRNVANARWQLLHPGVYATFTGPINDLATVWAAVLYAGEGAAASHTTALWLAGVLDDRPAQVHVSIPATRRVRPQSGVRIHRTWAPADSVHPAALPRRSRVETAVLDQSELAPANAALDLVFRATQRRFTTAERLRKALLARPRHRFRKLLMDVLDEVDSGVQSALERRYLRDVERPHRLPSATRNRPERATGSSRYRDVRYRLWSAVVELDGREAHPPDGAFRDHRRDNASTVAGDVSLRYGWRDVAGDPCAVAAEVAAVLLAQGWPGPPAACGPSCTLHRAS